MSSDGYLHNLPSQTRLISSTSTLDQYVLRFIHLTSRRGEQNEVVGKVEKGRVIKYGG